MVLIILYFDLKWDQDIFFSYWPSLSSDILKIKFAAIDVKPNNEIMSGITWKI